MAKVLVTGAAGFIGSHLCDELLRRGHSVIGIDNLSTGIIENIAHLKGNRNFSFLEKDVTDYDAIKDLKVDWIMHLASRASPIDYQKYPVETALSNSIGTHNMLRLAKKNNARMLFSSTSEAYGQPKIHPQKEDYWGNVNPTGVRSCYDESKRFGEALLMAYHRQYGTDVKIVRIFNTYGPRMRKDDGRVIPNFINQALSNEPITIYGDGSQTRSFCYVSDTVDGLIRMMESKYTGPKNIGNPHEMTILQAAQKIKDIIESSSELVFKPLPTDDPTKRQPDISEAREFLGWEPKIGFEEGIEKTIDFFRGLQ